MEIRELSKGDVIHFNNEKWIIVNIDREEYELFPLYIASEKRYINESDRKRYSIFTEVYNSKFLFTAKLKLTELIEIDFE